MIDLASSMFKGYGKFMLFVMLALIFPGLTHQHLNFSSFEYQVRILSRYGFLFIGLGILVKEVLGGSIQ